MRKRIHHLRGACIILLFTLACAAGCGGGGGGGTVTPPAQCAAVPAVPSGLGSSGTTSSGATISWTAVTAPANCSVTYTVYENGTVAASGVTGTSANISSLAANTTYRFTVAAVDAAGASSQSSTLSITTTSGSSGSGTTYKGITLTGKLIWHSYTTYGFTGVQSWMANLDTGNVYQITPSNVSGAMNFDFNPAGTEVVFMGNDNNNSGSTQAWDIWIANVTSTGLSDVTKITEGAIDGSRNEDPKFSSDGTKIIFKRNLDYICSIDTSSITVNGVDQTPALTQLLSAGYESSMPYYLAGSDTNFVFTDDSNTTYSTIQYDNGGTITTLYAPSGEHAYYPIALNSTQFYFSQSDSFGHDQVVLGDTSGDAAVSAAFDLTGYEFADPFPFNASWLSYSSSQPGSVSGSYDIWIGNFSTGVTYDLNNWIARSNQTNSNLGSTFYGTVSTQ
jgi:hypothetical protein